jgi:hypothetical protein
MYGQAVAFEMRGLKWRGLCGAGGGVPGVGFSEGAEGRAFRSSRHYVPSGKWLQEIRP